jgi:hypothetical protein
VELAPRPETGPERKLWFVLALLQLTSDDGGAAAQNLQHGSDTDVVVVGNVPDGDVDKVVEIDVGVSQDVDIGGTESHIDEAAGRDGNAVGLSLTGFCLPRSAWSDSPAVTGYRATQANDIRSASLQKFA